MDAIEAEDAVVEHIVYRWFGPDSRRMLGVETFSEVLREAYRSGQRVKSAFDWIKSDKPDEFSMSNAIEAEITEAVAEERERCAKVAEELRGNWSGTMYDASVQIAAAIRGTP